MESNANVGFKYSLRGNWFAVIDHFGSDLVDEDINRRLVVGSHYRLQTGSCADFHW